MFGINVVTSWHAAGVLDCMDANAVFSGSIMVDGVSHSQTLYPKSAGGKGLETCPVLPWI